MKINPALWFLVVVLGLQTVNSGWAQMVYSYDLSGNPTNSVVSSSTAVSDSVTNSTPVTMIGSAISLEAAAGGSGPLTYQWQLNGVNISGATNATYFKASAATGDAGVYTVVVTGASGSMTNSLGTVTVLANTNNLYAVVFALSEYVAVGANGAIVVSSNLVSWSAPSSGTTNQLRGIVFGTNLLVAVGTSGTVVTSTNGTTWVLRTSGVTNDLNGVTFGGHTFVAIGAGGTTLTSPDGVNWTRQTYDNPTLEATTFGNNLFVAVGTGGSIWTSSNGTNWLGHNWSTTNSLSAVTFGNGLFIAMGGSGLILSSPDGTNWNQQVAVTSEPFSSVLFFTNTFFGLGPIGQNFISADGFHWGESPAGTFAPLNGSAAGNGVPVAVGANGTIVPIPYNQLDHFVWSAIPSPQRAGLAFPTALLAQDAANNTLSNFNGSVTLSAAITQSAATHNLIGAVSPSLSVTGSYTFGYSFTPTNDLLVTQLWHYDTAQKVSIWDEDGNLVVTLNVTNVPLTWIATPVPVPVTLRAGTSYVLGAYTGTSTNGVFYYRTNLSAYFTNGTIDQAFWGNGDVVPQHTQSAFWFLVDLSYIVQGGPGTTVTPTNATVINGVANFNVSVSNTGQGTVLTTMDSQGHVGLSNPFNVYATNDLTLTLTSSPATATFQSNLTYTITIMNSGSPLATGVNVTNVLPANVGFVSASSSQGLPPQYANGVVTCNLGTVGDLALGCTISIVVTSKLAGIMLTNTASVTETGSDSNLSDNTATLTTYVPPTLSITGGSLPEGNTGLVYWNVPVTLSSAGVLPVYVTATTLNGTNATPAVAGNDYAATSRTLYFAPGTTSNNFVVGVQGNILIQSNRQFIVRLSNPVNATLLRGQDNVTIVDDDGIPGQMYNLLWSNVSTPQTTNQTFVASLTAQDASGTTVSNFAGPVSLVGINVNGPSTSTLLPSPTPESSTNVGIFTVGYQFMPTNDIYVTHVRTYTGSKVSIWTDTGCPLISQTVSNLPGTWVETALPLPYKLSANTVYRIGAFTDGSPYYWRDDGAPNFNDGQIIEGYSSPGNGFPTNMDAAMWYLVDLRYVRAASMTPTNASSFTNGVWAGNINAKELGTNFFLMADDGNGHWGFSNPFGVYQTNDLAVTLASSPAVPLVWTNLTYTITVLNPGPNSSTGVFATNVLPAGATFVTASGTWSQAGGVVTFNIGTLSGNTSATVTVTVTPLVAGLPLTNSVTVTRNEADPNQTNNSAVSVVIPSLALSLALSQATEYFWTSWRSGGDNLWGVETNITHDGIDAAQSGAIIDSQQSWMETTVRGPGTLTFWWKVSSQAGGDLLWFTTNGVAVTNISGNIDWQQVSRSLTQGLYVLRWSYIKDPSISSGSDAGWLDQVSYTIPSFNLVSPLMATNRAFSFTVDGGNGQQLILQGSTNLAQWTSLVTNVVSGGVINYTDLLATNFPQRYYRAVFMNK